MLVKYIGEVLDRRISELETLLGGEGGWGGHSTLHHDPQPFARAAGQTILVICWYRKLLDVSVVVKD